MPSFAVSSYARYQSYVARQPLRGVAVWRWSGVAVVLALMVACAARVPPHREAGEESAPAPNSSKALGQAFLHEALQTYRFVKDPDVTGPVQRTGQRLVDAIGEDPTAFHFFVVDVPQLNAFAIPGGYIFVFTGLLAKLDDEEELAGVLAHELGHVQHNHFFQDDSKIQALNLASIAALLLSKGNPAAFAFTQGAGYNLQLGYSREHEAEADASAVGYLRKAGYDPNGLVRFFRALEFYERFNPPQVPDYFMTHPGVSERLRVVQAMVGEEEHPGHAEQPSLEWGRLRASVAIPIETAAPLSSGERYLRAVARLKQNRTAEAIDDLRAVLAVEPHHARARADLGLALLKTRAFADAETAARQSLADDPNQALPSIVLGILAQDAGRHDEAIAHFQSALPLEPYDPMIHFRLAQSFAAHGDRALETYHMGWYFRLNLQPKAAGTQLKQVAADAQADPELRRRAQRDLAEIRREGV